MNKHQFLIEQKRLEVQKLHLVLTFLSKAVFYATVLAGTWVLFWGIRPLFSATRPDVINAFAGLVEKLQIGTILGYIWAGTATALYVAERRSKKRAIHQKSALQHELENGDPNRTSSGLTATGDTPKENRNA